MSSKAKEKSTVWGLLSLFILILITVTGIVIHYDNALEETQEALETTTRVKQEINDELWIMKDTLQELQENYNSSLDKVTELDSKVKEVTKENETLKTQVDTLNKNNDTLNGEINTLKSENNKLKDQLSQKKAKDKAIAKAKESTKAPSTSSKVVQASAPKSKAPSGGKTLYMNSTAYTAFCNGCSGITATGINLRANPGMKVIAVDPNVIPLGSKVYVEGYGTAIAGDTGGAIKGNKIDVFIPDKKRALSWGRKQVSVTILN